MNSKTIIIATILLMLIGFSFLFIVEAKNHNPDFNKSWSVAYFNNPRDNSLDFSIENHQGKTGTYEYEIFSGDNKDLTDSVEIRAGEKQKITPVLDADNLTSASRITILVSLEDMVFKIYKNIK
jgi:hypothetical protein